MNPLFHQQELPFEALEELGLFSGKEMRLDNFDIKALLAGRRTALITLTDLHLEHFQIEKLDAKLSLLRNPNGAVELRLHPIYRNVQGHALLSDQEIANLSSGRKAYLQKSFQDSTGRSSLMNFEYDELTRDFVSYFPDEVKAPDFVNGQRLSAQQQSTFQRGELLELADGTRLQHRASEVKGILSDRAALVLSVLIDGGISYLLLRGLRAIKGEEGLQVDYNTPAYKEAFSAMQGRLKQDVPIQPGQGIGENEQQYRRVGPYPSR